MANTTGLAFPLDVAYCVPGSSFKRRTFKSSAAYEKFIAKMNDEYGRHWELRIAADCIASV
jgi:hypothetical protein